MSEDIHSRLAGRWVESGAAASTAAISSRAWLRLFVGAQAAMIAAVLLWPRMPWLPFLCDAVMSALTFFFAADRLRRAKRDVRLIWMMLLTAMGLLSIGHFLQSWVLLGAETGVIGWPRCRPR